MNTLIEALQTAPMQNALATCVLISIACGLVGAYVVINRLVFISGGISHSALGGVGIGIHLGLSNLLYSTLGFSLLAAFVIGYVQDRFHERTDTLIGAIWAIGMGLGILLIESGVGEGEEELESFLFGNIEAVQQSDLLLMLIVTAIILLVISTLYKELLAISFDQTFSAIRNLPVRLFNYLLLGLIAITVVIMMRAVGLILVIALLTIPAAIAGHYTRKLKVVMGVGVLLSLFFTIGGLVGAYFIGLSPGPAIVMLAGIGYLISLVPRIVASKSSLRAS